MEFHEALNQRGSFLLLCPIILPPLTPFHQLTCLSSKSSARQSRPHHLARRRRTHHNCLGQKERRPREGRRRRFCQIEGEDAKRAPEQVLKLGLCWNDRAALLVISFAAAVSFFGLHLGGNCSILSLVNCSWIRE